MALCLLLASSCGNVNGGISLNVDSSKISPSAPILGSFTIGGVGSLTESTMDAFLSDSVTPTIQWTTSANAATYDVSIYEDDGTTLKCAIQSTVSTSLNLTGCNLTPGQYYKSKVTARALTLSQDASNNFYRFFVNSLPTPANDGPVRIMKGSGAITLDVLTASDSATRGTVADSDPDAGDTLAITAVTQGSSGGTVGFTSSQVTYTVPSASFTGVETFTYTISDNHGGTATGTVTIHVFDTYTWTGKTSSNWNVNGNWCGTITNNLCNGTTGYPNDTTTATKVAIFDGTCLGAGHNCNASINTAVSAYGVKLNSGYSGVLTQAAGGAQTVAIGDGGWVQVEGQFDGGDANINFTGTAGSSLDVSGGTFKSTSGTLNLNSNISVTGTGVFSHNNGTVAIIGNGGPSSTIDCQTSSLKNVLFQKSHSSLTITGVVQADGALTYDMSGGGGGNFLSGEIRVKGDVTVANTAASGSGMVTMNGSTNQTLSSAGKALPKFKIASTGGTVSVSGTVNFFNEFSYVSGTVDFTTSTVGFVGNGMGNIQVNNVDSLHFYNLTFNKFFDTHQLFSDIHAYGTLTCANSSGTQITGGFIIYAHGDVTVNAGADCSGTPIVANGSGNQTITGNTSGIDQLRIDSSGGTVFLVGHLRIYREFKYINGSVDATGSIVNFYGNGIGNATVTSGSVQFQDVIFNKYFTTTTLMDDMTVLGNITCANSSGGAVLGTQTIHLSGNIDVTSDCNGSNISLRLVGSGNQTVSVTSGSIFGQQITIDKASGNVSLLSNLSLNGSGQDLQISAGTLLLSGFTLTVNDYLTIDPGATMTLGGGSYTPNSLPKLVNNGTINF